MKRNFTFIPNHIEIDGGVPFELIPSFNLRKACPSEIKEIEKHLKSISSLISKMGELPYSVSYSFEEISENEVYQKTEKLDESEWKYYVVEYDDNEHGILLSKFQLVANLSVFPLELDTFQFEKNGNSYIFSYSPDRAYRFFSDNDLTSKVHLKTDDLIKLKERYAIMCEIETNFHGIMNSIYLFNSLRYLPKNNEYRILGLFTVLESLITHKPSSNETGDSLTHQIKTKIPLLFKRLDDRTLIDSFYSNEKLKTLWGKLYSYRSSIAHGNQADFGKELQILKNPIEISEYLTVCIKGLILQALKEPELIQDLKQC